MFIKKENFRLISVLLISNILSAILRLIFELNYEPKRTFFLTFYAFEVTYYFFAVTFGFIRTNKLFDIPVFYEMPAYMYWSLVLLIDICFKAPFISKFIEISGLSLIIYLSFTFFIISVVIQSYQMYIYDSDDLQAYNQRLQELINKANITKDELLSVQNELIQRVNIRRKTPVVWKLLRFMIMIILGSTLGVLSSKIFNNLGITFNDFIFPE